jgi:hypothetical protein
MKVLLAAILLLMTSLAVGAERVIATLTDPLDDDFGNGSLLYPESPYFSKGDLDLRTLKISADDRGFWFEAAFARPVRDPARVTSGVGPEPIPVAARRGFYAFNIDIYVDTDRLPNSGNTFTLPGRKARIDSAYAWERAIVLTPRPEQARSELFEVLSRQFPARSIHEIEASIDQAVFFPTEVRVRGKSISFFVPKTFMGDTDGSDWAVTTLVTGARLYSSMSLNLLQSSKTPLEMLDMGAMQPALGRPADTFGFESAVPPSPIVDVLLPTTVQQKAMLANNLPLTGMSWGPRAANEAAQSQRYQGALAETSAQQPPQSGKEGSLIANTWSSLKSLFDSNTGQPQGTAPGQPGKPVPVQTFLDPGKPGMTPVEAAPAGMQPQPQGNMGGVATAASSPAGTTPAAQKPSVAARLRMLKQLYDDKLIDEAEYRLHKQRILGDL